MGYRNLIDNSNYFFHVGGGSNFGKNRPHQVALMTYGCFIDTVTNYQTISLLFILPLYLIYLASLLIFLPLFRKFNYRFSQEIVIAFSKFTRDYLSIIGFRKKVQKLRTVKDSQIHSHISLIPSVFTRFRLTDYEMFNHD